ncbi:hypothetical protein LMG6000_06811 [Achromobacter insolitus]|uniref:Uncharacterized protein n=1 Tax=Achromobacter insolitus TaxID=217204 RepID=A0A6S7FKY2_9BURK|nr:hypothetical protein LMG6000_06811 [Achromobacter insolitus]CAB3949510.1 hypothetical protein LMG5997_06700 [Achromobacter insolitus]
MASAVSVMLPGWLSAPSAPTPATKRPALESEPDAVAISSPPASTEPALSSADPARSLACVSAEAMPALSSAPPALRSSAAPACRRLSAVTASLSAALTTRLPACVAVMPPSVASVPARKVMPCSVAAEPSAVNAPAACAVNVPAACRCEAAPSAISPRCAVSDRSSCKAATVPSTVIVSPAIKACESPASRRPAACNTPCALAVSLPPACAAPPGPTVTSWPVSVRLAWVAAKPSVRASRAASSSMSPTELRTPAAYRSRST